MIVCFYSGTAWVATSRQSITRKLAWSGKSTCKCIPIGTPGITIGSAWRKRSGNATGPTIQVNISHCTAWLTSLSFFSLVVKWHALTKDDQSKYYEMAKQERSLHMQLHPNWTARENYAKHKKKRKKKDKIRDSGTGKFNVQWHGVGGAGVLSSSVPSFVLCQFDFCDRFCISFKGLA